MRIRIDEREGLFARLGERRDVADERRREPKVALPGLGGRAGLFLPDRAPTEKLPFAADLEVLLREQEAVGARLNRREPLARRLTLVGISFIERRQQQACR